MQDLYDQHTTSPHFRLTVGIERSAVRFSRLLLSLVSLNQVWDIEWNPYAVGSS